MSSKKKSNRMISDLICAIIRDITNNNIALKACFDINNIETNSQTSDDTTRRWNTFNYFGCNRYIDSNNSDYTWIWDIGGEIVFIRNNDKFIGSGWQKISFNWIIRETWVNQKNFVAYSSLFDKEKYLYPFSSLSVALFKKIINKLNISLNAYWPSLLLIHKKIYWLS